jgi:dipeptidyl aminopeptidase/acylaminoacyl peptidase
MQLEDFDTVLDWAKSHNDIDPNRVVVWGYSYGGGNVGVPLHIS